MSKRRVVVTGLGAVTPIGNNVEDFWAGIREGKVGIGPITKFDTTDYKVKINEIPIQELTITLVSKRISKRTDQTFERSTSLHY